MWNNHNVVSKEELFSYFCIDRASFVCYIYDIISFNRMHFAAVFIFFTFVSDIVSGICLFSVNSLHKFLLVFLGVRILLQCGVKIS